MIPVFYDDRQTVTTSQGCSPSAGKPRLVVDAWLADHSGRLRVQSFAPVTREDLCLVHDPSYVDGVLSLKRPNGFGTLSADVAGSLPWTTGSLVAAAEYAVEQRLESAGRMWTVAASPTSGFHHAGYNSGGGFCTFNGLMVAAARLVRRGLRVGILDLGAHYGDGTDEIIDRLGLWGSVVHWTFGQRIRDRVHAVTWLRHQLRTILVSRFARVDVVLCQAGASPHIDNPLGGYLTDAELYERDLMVFSLLRRMGKPVAWNLAGGYQDPLENVIDVHRATMDACIQVFTGRGSSA